MSGVVSGVIWCQRLLWEKPGCALHWPHWAHAKQRIVSLLAQSHVFHSFICFGNNEVKQKKSLEFVPTVPSSVACSLKTWTQIRKAGRLQPAQRSRWEFKLRPWTQTLRSFDQCTILFFLSLNAGNNKYRVVTMHWSCPGVSDRDKLMIWWTHWWNVLHTISAVSNLMRPKDQKTGRRAG